MPPQLPLELVNYVIAHLHDCEDTLHSCALVHRSWTAASQELIFDTVSSSEEYEDINLWDRLLNLLENSPHIRPYIRRLLISTIVPCNFTAQLLPVLYFFDQ
jgi:hypothetical protein